MNAKVILFRIVLVAVLCASFSCAPRHVISDQIRNEAETAVSFQKLVNETDRYMGKTVILGGYIIETKNVAGRANMTVLQTIMTRRRISFVKPDSINSTGNMGHLYTVLSWESGWAMILSNPLKYPI
ncbi:MAG: Slp family lipoprotein [Deltaproteobacteria bacterium]|nr:Slp family lipoprotein [Deltaproteobacteria bacterium]